MELDRVAVWGHHMVAWAVLMDMPHAPPAPSVTCCVSVSVPVPVSRLLRVNIQDIVASSLEFAIVAAVV